MLASCTIRESCSKKIEGNLFYWNISNYLELPTIYIYHHKNVSHGCWETTCLALPHLSMDLIYRHLCLCKPVLFTVAKVNQYNQVQNPSIRFWSGTKVPL